MINKHTEYENIIKESINDMKYEIQSLVKLLDNEPRSEGGDKFILKLYS